MSEPRTGSKPWIEALDLQGELHRFWTSPNGRAAMDGAARLWERDQRRSEFESGGITAGRIRRTPEIEAAKLRRCFPYWVGIDMVRLVDHAAKSMEAETLEETDLPIFAGFVLLSESVAGLFVSEDDAAAALAIPTDPPLVAFSWGLTRGVVEIMAYTSEAAVKPKATGWPKGVMILNQHDWPLGEALDSDDDYWPVHRFIKAFWALCQQRIGQGTTGTLDRPSRRRAERAGLNSETLTGVQVVTLRRRATVVNDLDGESEPVDWSCRWIVQGHWRNQWYPSAGTHRQIWIEPHEKGPEDAPLKLTDRVYKVTR